MIQFLHQVTLGVGLATLLSFAWAPILYFTPQRDVPLSRRWPLWIVYAIGILHAVALFRMNHHSAIGDVIGLVLYLFALGLFWHAVRQARDARLSAFFQTTLPQKLLTAGVYRYLRHPFYTSYLLGWMAGCAATGWLPLILTVPLAFLLYYRAASQEERFLLQSPFGKQYGMYCAKTGRFAPAWRTPS